MKAPKNILKVIFVNSILALHLSICLSLTSLIPQISDQNGYKYLGAIAITSIYSAELLFNFVAPIYLKKMKYRYGFALQALLVVPCYFSSLYLIANCHQDSSNPVCAVGVITILGFLGSFSFGAGLGGYFVLQNSYVSDCAEESKELLFGITYTMMGLSALISGLYSEFFLILFGRDYIFLYSGIIVVVLSLMFLFVIQPLQSTKVEDAGGKQLEIQSDSIVITPTFWESLKQIKWLMMQKSNQIYFPLYLITGIVIGYEYGFFYKFIIESLPEDMTSQMINQKTARIFQFIGLAQAISGILNGFINKHISIYLNTIVFTKLLSCMIVLSIISAYEKSFTIVGILGFFIGFCDNSGQFNAAVTISQNYADSLEIYGIYFFFQNFGIVIVILLSQMINSYSLIYNMILIMSVVFLVGLTSHKVLRSQKIDGHQLAETND